MFWKTGNETTTIFYKTFFSGNHKFSMVTKIWLELQYTIRNIHLLEISMLCPPKTQKIGIFYSSIDLNIADAAILLLIAV